MSSDSSCEHHLPFGYACRKDFCLRNIPYGRIQLGVRLEFLTPWEVSLMPVNPVNESSLQIFSVQKYTEIQYKN